MEMKVSKVWPKYVGLSNLPSSALTLLPMKSFTNDDSNPRALMKQVAQAI
jgi:hypothetical protein